MVLKDGFGRIHDYLRISLTDKCNLRCHYCLPNDINFLPQEKLMSTSEIIDITRIFIYNFGVKKIRFTGGEPLTSKNAYEVIKEVSKFPVELAISTNGILLNEFLPLFKQIGMTSLNISLDSLNRKRFKDIAKHDKFDVVKNNINNAFNTGFKIKINMVVMKKLNDDEIFDFVNWTLDFPIHIRFIEFMPFHGNNWNQEKVISYMEMKEQIQNRYNIEELSDHPNSTSKGYRVVDARGTFAFISTVTDPFCQSCNRLRLSADGKLRNCLFARNEVDLLTAYRNGSDLKKLIQISLESKAEELGGISPFADIIKTPMINIGG